MIDIEITKYVLSVRNLMYFYKNMFPLMHKKKNDTIKKLAQEFKISEEYLIDILSRDSVKVAIQDWIDMDNELNNELERSINVNNYKK